MSYATDLAFARVQMAKAIKPDAMPQVTGRIPGNVKPTLITHFNPETGIVRIDSTNVPEFWMEINITDKLIVFALDFHTSCDAQPACEKIAKHIASN